MLKELIKNLSFVKGSKFEETKGTLIVRNSDRTTLQEQMELYLKKKGYGFKQRKKPTEIEVEGSSQVLIFKPIKARGTGGLKFEEQFTSDLNDWFSGVDLDKLKSGDTIKLVKEKLRLRQNSKHKAVQVGSRNTRRPPAFSGNKVKISNNSGLAVSDVDLFTSKTHYLSLKFSNSFYIYNGSIGSYFEQTNTKKGINEFFGFDGFKMGKAFGKKYATITKKPNYSIISNSLKQLIIEALGPDVVLVNKIAQGNNHVSVVNGFAHKVAITGLTKDSYIYAEKNIRKYNNIKFNAAINGATYVVSFQFRGTTSTDTGPRYLRILLQKK
jgi:hypothetical protein